MTPLNSPADSHELQAMQALNQSAKDDLRQWRAGYGAMQCAKETTMKTSIDGVEFSLMPRGSQRGLLNPIQIDCWQVGGRGWVFTMTNSQTGIGIGHGPGSERANDGALIAPGFNSFTACAQAAVCAARNWIHPI